MITPFHCCHEGTVTDNLEQLDRSRRLCPVHGTFVQFDWTRPEKVIRMQRGFSVAEGA